MIKEPTKDTTLDNGLYGRSTSAGSKEYVMFEPVSPRNAKDKLSHLGIRFKEMLRHTGNMYDGPISMLIVTQTAYKQLTDYDLVYIKNSVTLGPVIMYDQRPVKEAGVTVGFIAEITEAESKDGKEFLYDTMFRKYFRVFDRVAPREVQ